MTDSKRRVPCEVYSRVVGYLRPVETWNPGKQQEFEDRVLFSQPMMSEAWVRGYEPSLTEDIRRMVTELRGEDVPIHR